MRNSFETTLKVNRLEICDLLLACLAARELANDGGEKWNRLHDKLKEQLKELDRQLDAITEDENR